MYCWPNIIFVQDNYPNTIILSLEKNYGFGIANNHGIKAAQGEYIALLNNDTIADQKWLETIVNILDSQSDISK